MAPAGKGQTRYVQSETVAYGTVPAEHYSRAGRAEKAYGVHKQKPSAGETKPELKGSQKKKGARATFLTIRIKMDSPQKRGGSDGVGIVVLLDAQMS